MERKLASIQRIESIAPIEGAESIEKATVLGWEVVVKKGDFLPGQLCVYCEVDSILPDRPEFEFLRDRKFRIRTIKLRGQVSQGICFPMHILKDYRLKNVMTGTDVTEYLGVKKYDPQAEFERKETERAMATHNSRMDKLLKRYSWYRKLFMKPKNNRLPMPSFISKTDEDRIQNFPNACSDWYGVPFVATEKLDGQSATYFVIPNPKRGLFRKKWLFGVCSRNFQLMAPDNSSYWEVAAKEEIEKKMLQWCESRNAGLIIQGEIIGRGIQGNKYGLADRQLYVFNIMRCFPDGKKHKFSSATQNIMCLAMGLRGVPVIADPFYLPTTIHDAVEMTKGSSVLENIPREGLVIRNYSQNISFKIINPDFLLKYSE
jgi:RNA ligase (TIGR02306 family)